MGKKAVDNRPSDLYLFMETLSVWLNESNILNELRMRSSELSPRCKSVLQRIPDIFTNIQLALATEDDLWGSCEKLFKGRNNGEFLNADMIHSVLNGAEAFVVEASKSCREALIKELCLLPCETTLCLKKMIRRIAEVAFGKRMGELSFELPDEEYYHRFFALFAGEGIMKVDDKVIWDSLAIILNVPTVPDVFVLAAFDFVRRMESMGRLWYNYKTEEFYYWGLVGRDVLSDVEGYERWRVSLLAHVPYGKRLVDCYINLAFRLRGRAGVDDSLAPKAILNILRSCKVGSDGYRSFDEYDCRVRALCITQKVWRACLSKEEQEEVRRFIFRAWGAYRPADLAVYNFMQEIMQLDIAPWLEIVQKTSEEVTPNVSFFPHVLLEGDQVDVAVSTDTRALLMNVLPDKDYEVAGSINDECHGSISLVRDGVISLGFVSMLQRIQNTLCRLEPDSSVNIGIVASRKTLLNVAKALEDVGLTYFRVNLNLFEYEGLKDSIEYIMRSEDPCPLPCGPEPSDVD